MGSVGVTKPGAHGATPASQAACTGAVTAAGPVEPDTGVSGSVGTVGHSDAQDSTGMPFVDVSRRSGNRQDGPLGDRRGWVGFLDVVEEAAIARGDSEGRG